MTAKERLRETGGEMESKRQLPSADPIPRHPQQSDLGKVKPRIQERHPALRDTILAQELS